VEILFQDRDLVVCVKPVGMLSEEGGMPDALREELGGEIYCVHRLDRAVGGLMVFARNRKAASALSALISGNGLDKEYLAVVPDKLREDKGVFEDLLFHDRQKNRSYVVKRERGGVKKAQLEYEKLESVNSLALVRVHLITGRSHQIRCQFASRAMPLSGDVKYGSTIRDTDISLFSHRLSFYHPFTGEKLDFTVFPEGKIWSGFNLENLVRVQSWVLKNTQKKVKIILLWILIISRRQPWSTQDLFTKMPTSNY